ncbi:MAG: hypothetical protein K5769_05250 [Pseudobutyrivibrio sp.]|nr:hypothetical protein [Pseudobutyrivibrio sp.]
MKEWVEKKKITDYYHWVTQSELEQYIVHSYNATEVVDHTEFVSKCLEWVKTEIPSFEEYKFYLLCPEIVKDSKSRVERYKKCWKKLSETFDIGMFETSNEYEMDYEGQICYVGLIRSEIKYLNEIIKILKVKQQRYLLFLSRADYFKHKKDQEQVISRRLSFEKDQKVNYEHFFKACIDCGDIPFRYGDLGTEAELAMVCNENTK